MTLVSKLLSPLALLALTAIAGSQTAAYPAAPQKAAPHFAVRVTGKGKPILLIPGLTCGGDVWDETVARLKDRYECHVLTLPGFGGQPAMPGPTSSPYLKPIRDEIIAYVKAKRLDHPAIIGHSLGGLLGFSLESTAPDLFGPLVAVDGAPWLMALFDPKATVDSIRPQVEAMKKGMVSAYAMPEGFRQSTRAALATQVKDPKRVESILETSAQSDPTTVMNAMAEMMLTDLRPATARITAPLLLLAAGDWAKTPEMKTLLQKAYEDQVARVKNARVVPVWDARHFIMFDDPALFHREVERFLETSWSAR